MDERGKVMIAIGAGGADEIIPRRSVGFVDGNATLREQASSNPRSCHLARRRAGPAGLPSPPRPNQKSLPPPTLICSLARARGPAARRRCLTALSAGTSDHNYSSSAGAARVTGNLRRRCRVGGAFGTGGRVAEQVGPAALGLRPPDAAAS